MCTPSAIVSPDSGADIITRNKLDPAEYDKGSAARTLGTGRLLLTARRAFTARVAERMKALKLGELPPPFVMLLPYLDSKGTRSVELAQAAGISKQAVAKIVSGLEDMGLLVRSADPSDARASLVKLTPRGLKLLAASRRAVDEVEQEYEAMLGKAEHERFRATLSKLAFDAAVAPAPTPAKRRG